MISTRSSSVRTSDDSRIGNATELTSFAKETATSRGTKGLDLRLLASASRTLTSASLTINRKISSARPFSASVREPRSKSAAIFRAVSARFATEGSDSNSATSLCERTLETMGEHYSRQKKEMTGSTVDDLQTQDMFGGFVNGNGDYSVIYRRLPLP